MRHKSVLLDEVAEFFRINSPLSAGNSPLDLHSADFANLGRFADFSPVSHPKFAKNHESQTENPSVVDSALYAQNLGENNAQIAESSDKIQLKKPFKSFCYFWLSPKVESPLPLNPNLPNNVESQNLGENKTKIAESSDICHSKIPLCHSERSEESQKNNLVILSEAKNLKKNNQNRVSSPLAQNDNVKKVQNDNFEVEFLCPAQDYSNITLSQNQITYSKYPAFTYIITNKINTALYIGVTSNLQKRIYEHKNHLISGFSDKYNCEKLVYFESFENIKQAIEREKYLKGKKRDFKENLINSINSQWLDLYQYLFESYSTNCYSEHCERSNPLPCYSERSEEFQKNNSVILNDSEESQKKNSRDSSVASLPQNDNIKKAQNNDFGNNIDSAPILIDATLGLGGHSERLLDENPTLKIIGIDKDEIVLEFAKNRLKRFGARFSAVQGSNAEQIKQILRTHKNIYGILADLGISSPQVDNLERGFSVKSSVLDMRMDLSASLDAKFVLNNYPKDELARIFREFGEIKGAEKIANLIAESRRKSPIKSGEDLCKIVERHTKWRDGIHHATLIFQAIRIEVNNELGDLGEFLANIAHLKGTKVAIISFHSLEDRLVKRAFKAWSAGCVCDEGAMKCVCGGKNERGEIITKKPIIPSAREIAANNRARSAKMRCFKFK